MQKPHGFAPLGDATGPVKTAIFGGNNARLYDIDPARAANDIGRDQLSSVKLAYEANGPARSNLRYGNVTGPMDPAVFVS